jgi:hypothetical protein
MQSMDTGIEVENKVQPDKWVYIEPKDACDVAIIQEGLSVGIKCNKLDIRRLGSSVLNEQIKASTFAGSVILLRNLFTTSMMMEKFFRIFISREYSGLPPTEFVEYIRCADRLELLRHHPVGQRLLESASHYKEVSAMDLMHFGKKYQDKDLFKEGAIRFATSNGSKEALNALSHEQLKECADVWLPMVQQAHTIQKALLQPMPTVCNACYKTSDWNTMHNSRNHEDEKLLRVVRETYSRR